VELAKNLISPSLDSLAEMAVENCDNCAIACAADLGNCCPLDDSMSVLELLVVESTSADARKDDWALHMADQAFHTDDLPSFLVHKGQAVADAVEPLRCMEVVHWTARAVDLDNQVENSMGSGSLD